MSFLFSVYILFVTIIVFGISQALDQFNKRGKVRYGFMVLCIIFSVISAFIMIVTVFVRMKPHEEETQIAKELEIIDQK
jgi:putative exporter of polyketide antibiotics